MPRGRNPAPHEAVPFSTYRLFLLSHLPTLFKICLSVCARSSSMTAGI